MQNRIAVLILAHRPEALPYLVSLLPPPFDIFIHYDAKAGSPPLLAAPNLRFITRREVFWGGFSMVAATLDLLQAARLAGGYARYLLISGDSLPLRPAAQLAETLLRPDEEYIQLTELADVPATKGKSRDEIRTIIPFEHPGRFYNFQEWDSLFTNPFAEAALCAAAGLDLAAAQNLRSAALRASQTRLAALPPRPRLFPQFYYGTQWWALTAGLIDQILPRLLASEVQDYFRFMEVPDEHYFNCIIGNLLQTPAVAGFHFNDSQMLTDVKARSEGRISVFSEMLRNAAHTTPKLFMRKFHPDAALDVARAIRTGRYAEDILAL